MTTQATASFAPRRDEQELLDERFAMRLSLIFGLAMLIGKTTAYFMTHSAAIFSDAAESVIHERHNQLDCLRRFLRLEFQIEIYHESGLRSHYFREYLTFPTQDCWVRCLPHFMVFA
jgi:hypothetical protein